MVVMIAGEFGDVDVVSFGGLTVLGSGLVDDIFIVLLFDFIIWCLTFRRFLLENNGQTPILEMLQIHAICS